MSARSPEPILAVHEALRSPGATLDPVTLTEMGARFGHDFSRVRVHTDSQAAEATRAVDAQAFTVGHHIVFGERHFAPWTDPGQRLVAHELTHVLQQRAPSATPVGALEVASPEDPAEQEAHAVVTGIEHQIKPVTSIRKAAPLVQRAPCLTSAADCPIVIPGSAEAFGAAEETAEDPARARRRRMSPTRQRSTGHIGHARQLEHFLSAQSPGLMGSIHGIFIDMDMSPTTGAMVMQCDEMVPPITGATKPCVFVHGDLNQQALAFNKTSASTIGGVAREDWRIDTLQTFTHEIQHVVFGAVAHSTPVGSVCTHADVEVELSELNAIMSEFPVMFRAIPVGAPASHPARIRLRAWFNAKINGAGESIEGILRAMRCECACNEVDDFVKDTVNFASASWSATERSAFNTKLRDPARGLGWPL